MVWWKISTVAIIILVENTLIREKTRKKKQKSSVLFVWNYQKVSLHVQLYVIIRFVPLVFTGMQDVRGQEEMMDTIARYVEE